jgi:hypothetical protein
MLVWQIFVAGNNERSSYKVSKATLQQKTVRLLVAFFRHTIWTNRSKWQISRCAVSGFWCYCKTFNEMGGNYSIMNQNALNITGVSLCILALVTRHADRVFPALYYVVICGLSVRLYHIMMCFYLLYNFARNISHSKNISAIYYHNVHRS